jgi:hypothetical protein
LVYSYFDLLGFIHFLDQLEIHNYVCIICAFIDFCAPQYIRVAQLVEHGRVGFFTASGAGQSHANE